MKSLFLSMFTFMTFQGALAGTRQLVIHCEGKSEGLQIFASARARTPNTIFSGQAVLIQERSPTPDRELPRKIVEFFGSTPGKIEAMEEGHGERGTVSFDLGLGTGWESKELVLPSGWFEIPKKDYHDYPLRAQWIEYDFHDDLISRTIPLVCSIGKELAPDSDMP